MIWERKFMSEGGRLRLVQGSLQGVESADPVADLVEEAIDLHVDGDADRIGKAQRVGAAMALDADAVEPEEDRAVVAARIEPLAQLLERARGEEIADARHQRILKGGTQEVHEQACRSLAHFYGDVAGKAVGHDDVYRACSNVVAFDKAVKADRRAGIAQPRAGAAHGIIALEILDADIEQSDRRLQQAKHGPREDIAHQSELDEIVGVAFDIGAEIEHDAFAALRREE